MQKNDYRKFKLSYRFYDAKKFTSRMQAFYFTILWSAKYVNFIP